MTLSDIIKGKTVLPFHHESKVEYERRGRLLELTCEERVKIKYGDMPACEMMATARDRALKRLWKEEESRDGHRAKFRREYECLFIANDEGEQ